MITPTCVTRERLAQHRLIQLDTHNYIPDEDAHKWVHLMVANQFQAALLEHESECQVCIESRKPRRAVVVQ